MPDDRETVSQTTKPNQGLALVAFLIVCFSAAAIGSAFPPGEWYASLNRPSYAPPNWVFGPVWTGLYLMMAVSGWLVWRSVKSSGRALTFFGIQLVLNSLWSCLFFGLHRPGLALLEIVLLWAMIVMTILAFRQHSKLAAGLLVPYLLWVSFATVLNYGFWSLNS